MGNALGNVSVDDKLQLSKAMTYFAGYEQYSRLLCYWKVGG